MITKKQLKSQIEKLDQEIQNLSKIVVTEELKRLRIDKKNYDTQTELLSNIKFKVKSIKIIEEDSNHDNGSIVITYQLPTIVLPLNEKGEPSQKIPFFYSINCLGLIDNESYDKINNCLIKAKQKAEYKK